MSVILCYGDSNTWGFNIEAWSAKGNAAQPRFPAQVRWPGILAAELGPGHSVIEEGLNGRTTVFDDPVEGKHKNGSRYLLPCLESQAPVDLVVLCLGVNDVKLRFAAPACDIAEGAASLARTILASGAGPGGSGPRVLMVAPVPLGKGIASSPFGEMFGFEKGREKSLGFSKHYEAEAKRLGLAFLDAGAIVEAHPFDSLHLSAASHRSLGLAIAAKLREMGI
jgi:lysophospholipase L1-like esterase